MLAFGPIVSRRLGYSLGINHVPPKHCTYACVYCQVGRTTRLTIDRQDFYPLTDLTTAVETHLAAVEADGKTVDAMTLVPDGEPSLDRNLGALIDALQPYGKTVAVISNTSLISEPHVRRELRRADWVSLKMDAVREHTWKAVNRPHGRLRLPEILFGAYCFAREFKGRLVTETMLVAGLNDDDASLEALAAYLAGLQPYTAYLAVPFRPPAEPWVRVPSEERIQRAYQIFQGQDLPVELMLPAEPDPFVQPGSLADDLLSTSAVHPLDEPTVRKMAAAAGEDWSVVAELVRLGKLRQVHSGGVIFYLRALPCTNRHTAH